MTPPAVLPFATFRPVSYRAAAGPFTVAPLGWVLHVTVSNGSPFGAFQGAVSPNRRFSHLWVAKDGSCEQYAELTSKSWAQAAGNGLYWSVETEGFPAEALTDAQITTLARIHNALGAADAVVDTVGGKGIGTHVMGGAAWGGHTCPGPGPRAGQRQAIIDRAKALRAPKPPVTKPPASGIPAIFRKVVGGVVRAVFHRGPVLKVGASGPSVRALQVGLNRAFPAYSHLTADGSFGPATEAVVKEFQRRSHLTADGVVGPNTRTALSRSGVTF